MEKVVKIGDANVDVEALREYTESAVLLLSELESYKEDFKTKVEDAEKATGLPKKVLSAYFKARHKEQTKEAREKGELFEALDTALDVQP